MSDQEENHIKIEEEEYPEQILSIIQKKGTGDINDIEVSLVIDHIVTKDNINWGEIEDIDDLYKLGDKASELLGGIPDCILKPAINNVIILQIKMLENGWIRNHLEKVLKLWKQELLNEKPNKRDTKVVLESRNIEMFEPNKKKRFKNKSLAKHKMGISAMLAHARNTLCIGHRQHDIVDNEDGNIDIDGEPLTFEAWSKITENEAEDVVAVDDNFENKVEPKPTIEVVPEEKKKKRDLEDGELSDDDYPTKKRRARRDYDSESESDDEYEEQQKRKRALEREEQRSAANVNADLMKQRFDIIFKMRFEAINYLTVQQKVQLLQSLRMTRDENLFDDEMKRCVDLAKFLAQQ